MPSTWGIVVAAGRGARFAPDELTARRQPAKQFALLGDERVVDRSVRIASEACDRVVLVLAPDVAWDGASVHAVVAGGAEEADSVRSGLSAVPEDAEVIVVHDAARPLASRHLFDAVIAAVRAGADAAVPGLPMTDTVKRVEGDRVVETVRRDKLVAVQTPQAFRAAALRRAHADAPDAPDDAALVEACGARVVVVAGDRTNWTVTTPDDLVVAEALLGSSGR